MLCFLFGCTNNETSRIGLDANETLQSIITTEKITEEKQPQQKLPCVIMSSIEESNTTEIEINEETIEYTYSDINEIMYTTADLNVRKGPSIDFEVIGGLNVNTKVNVIAQCAETGWYKVEYNNSEGFVSNKYIQKEEAANHVEEPEEIESEVVIPSTTDIPAVIDYSNGIAQADGDIEQTYLDRVNDRLSVLPEKLLDTFKENDWQVIVTHEDMAQTIYKGKYTNILGSTSYRNKTLKIADNDKAVTDAPLHEFGHYFDSLLNFESKTDEFLEVLTLEEEAFKETFDVYYHWDNKEFFAGAFKEYFDNNEALRENCPQVYNIINFSLENFY